MEKLLEHIRNAGSVVRWNAIGEGELVVVEMLLPQGMRLPCGHSPNTLYVIQRRDRTTVRIEHRGDPKCERPIFEMPPVEMGQ